MADITVEIVALTEHEVVARITRPEGLQCNRYVVGGLIASAIQQEAGAVLYSCTDPATGEARDIVYLLTVRVVVDAPEVEQTEDAEVDAP